MPMPSTSKWPKPKSEDEFEDIVVDFLRIHWKDPHATRNGRRGQRQDGVDIVGHPPWLKGKTAGAQCKNIASVTLPMVVAEVEKAKRFKGGLGEFLFITAADRDAALQSKVREHFKTLAPPFHVEVIFWPDVVSDLSSDEQLVAKHWKGFSRIASSADALPPPVWIDRQGVRDEETVECQCELTVSVPEADFDVHASELTVELDRMAREGIAAQFFRTLLGQRKRVGDGFRWMSHFRECSNVLFKRELEAANRGVLTYRWAEFTDGNICLFRTRHLIMGAALPIGLYRLGVKRLVDQIGTHEPSRLGIRLVAHASAPMLLHDDCQTLEFMLSVAQSSADWSLAFESDWVSPPTIRLVNRVLANFSPSEGGSAAFPRINEGTLLRLLEQISGENKL